MKEFGDVISIKPLDPVTMNPLEPDEVRREELIKLTSFDYVSKLSCLTLLSCFFLDYETLER